jgi:hypothetical protein
MNRLLFGLVCLGLAGGFATGCTEDPTEAVRGSANRIDATRSYVQVVVGDSVQVIAQVLDEQGNPVPQVASVRSLDLAIVTVEVDTSLTFQPVTSTYFFVKGTGYGTTNVVVAEGDLADTIAVQTWPASIAITGLPDTMRSGDVVTYVATPVDVNGDPVAGAPNPTVTSISGVLVVDTIALTVTAVEAGTGAMQATSVGGSSGGAVTEVLPGVPASTELSAALFPAVAAGDSATLEILVLDLNDNPNNFPAELLSATTLSSDPGIATAEVVQTDTLGDENLRQFFVKVKGVAGGIANVSGTVTTSEGVLSYAAVPATVLAPVITLAGPSGAPGATITINGTGLASAGFLTQVLVAGSPVGNVISATPTAVTVQMPTLLVAAYSLEVSVGGVLSSNADTWTQTSAYNETATEPNGALGQETPIGASFMFQGSADETTDFGDLFQFEVTEDNVTIDLVLSWGDANDLDALIYPIGTVNPGTYGDDLCGPYELATLANPESGTCQLGAAGIYTLEIMHYGTGPTTYTVTGTIQ